MARLPTLGSDNGTWGEILNDYLGQSLNIDGTLKSSALSASGAATDDTVVHNTTNETITGIKTFTSSPIVPTPTNGTDAANKTYVDTATTNGTPDATISTKGKIQLAGDLGGTSAAPTVPGLAGKLTTASNLSDLASVSSARTNLGLGGSAVLSIGTTVNTVAAGDDSRITGAVQRGELVINVKDAPYGAKGNGVNDDTAAIIAAITAAEQSTASSRILIMPRGTYNTSGTITVQGTSGVTILAYGATISASLGAGIPALFLKTNPPNYTGGSKTTVEGLSLFSRNVGVSIGISIDTANQWQLRRVHITQFDVGLRLADTYYGGLDGGCSFYGNTVSIDIVGDQVNTIDLCNTKISGSSHLAGTTTYGIRVSASLHTVKFAGVTIEAVDYGFSYVRQSFDDAVFKLDQMYFEAIATCAIDFTQKDDQAAITVNMTSLWFTDSGKAAWLQVGTGSYSFNKSSFRTNRIYVDNTSAYRLSLNTDIPMSQIDFAQTLNNASSDGLVQINGNTVAFVDGNPYLYNAPGNYSTFPSGANHLPSLVDARPMVVTSPYDAAQMGKVYPLYTVNHKDAVWEAGSVVLKSPSGNYFKLTVDDSGTLTTRDVTANKKTFTPTLAAIPALEIGRREVRGGIYVVLAEGATTTVLETGRKATKSSGVINDVASNVRVFGTTLQAAATNGGGVSGLPFFWDTDIEYFYVWRSTFWAWSGRSLSESTSIRAIGTLAQRPTTPALMVMKYYATDNAIRYTWNGSSWS